MDIKELKEELSGLKNDLTGKTQEQIKSAMADMEVKFQKAIEEKMEGGVKAEDLAKFEEKYNEGVKSLQDHLDKLDVKMQSRKEGQEKAEGFIGAMKNAIRENYDSIKQVPDVKKFTMDVKAVADMTLSGHLTGDQPRDYDFDVAGRPIRLVHLADLIPSVSISGGTYTFPRRTTSEGSVSAATENSNFSQIDYDYSMIDVNTDFIAGRAVYSQKMANNLPFLESELPFELREDYLRAEDASFNTTLAAGVTASSEIITGQNKAEMIVAEMAALEGTDYMPNVVVVRPADWYDILITEKSTGAGYGLPGLITFEGGVLRFNGVPVVKANWLAANKYYVGDFSKLRKVITEGLSVSFSEHEEFSANNIVAKVRAQVGLAIRRTDAVIYGDFTAT